MKNVGKSLLVYAVGFVLVALLGMLVTSGSRYIDEHASQRDAKIALEDYLSTGRELPVGKYVSYQARWVLGPFATKTSTSTTNGATATSGVSSYYFLILEEQDSLSVMAMEVNNVRENGTLEQMSDWLLSVDGFPYGGPTAKVQGTLRELNETRLRNLYTSELKSSLGLSSDDPAVRYLLLDTTAGRGGIYLILIGSAAALILIAVLVHKAKKKPKPVYAPMQANTISDPDSYSDSYDPYY